LCIRDGAEVFAGDIDREKLDRLAKLGVEPLPNHDAPLTHECDILSPCARGGVLNDETIPKLRCKIVAGAANNQLSAPQSADRLLERGILYAPDYVINAGGIINIGVELAPGGYNEAEALRRTDAIGETLADVFRIAREEGVSTATAADRLAERRLEAGRPANARA
jgi:leucine dehydrogenase